jgi:hypothetical protein
MKSSDSRIALACTASVCAYLGSVLPADPLHVVLDMKKRVGGSKSVTAFSFPRNSDRVQIFRARRPSGRLAVLLLKNIES